MSGAEGIKWMGVGMSKRSLREPGDQSGVTLPAVTWTKESAGLASRPYARVIR